VNYPDENIWTAGNDIFEDTKWVWESTGRLMSSNYTNWGNGKPDLLTTSNCALIEYTVDYTWDDYPCDTVYRYICEGLPSSCH
jgi:hypothetical protein